MFGDVKHRVLGGLAGAFVGGLSRAERVARAELGCTSVAPDVLLPVTREMTRRLVGKLRRPRKAGDAFRGTLGGRDVSVVNSGVGAPAAEGKVVACLGLGARVLLRVDICGALDGRMKVGDVVVAERAIPWDGTSRLLAGDGEVAASSFLLTRAAEASRKIGLGRRYVVGVATVDTFHHQTDEMHRAWAASARAVDMETSIIYHLARRAGAHALAIMAVSDVRGAGLDPFGEGPFPYGDLMEGLERVAGLAAAIIGDLPGEIPAAD